MRIRRIQLKYFFKLPYEEFSRVEKKTKKEIDSQEKTMELVQIYVKKIQF